MVINKNVLKIGSNFVGDSFPTYFIADIAANHDGDIDRAKKLITLAKESGADAVKFQHHDVTKYVSDVGFKSLGGKYSHQASWNKTIFEVYKDAEVPKGWAVNLKKFCDEIGIDFFSTPYDLDLVDYLDPYVQAYKIGSGDIVWNAMIEKISSKNKPILFATGASTLEEVIHAHQLLDKYSNNLILMQCNTNYTGSDENFKYINLNVLNSYKVLFPQTILGLSDHTPGHETVLGAVALGAKAIEKHFTDDTGRNGPDHAFSMDPKSWSEMVKSTRILEQALGGAIKKVEGNELETIVLQRRAVRLTESVSSGKVLNPSLVEYQRPCPKDAISLNDIEKYFGKKLKNDMNEGEYLKHDDFA